MACRAELSPFADVVDGQCVGIMADLFVMSIGEFGLVAAIHPKHTKVGADLMASLTENRVLYLLS